MPAPTLTQIQADFAVAGQPVPTDELARCMAYYIARDGSLDKAVEITGSFFTSDGSEWFPGEGGGLVRHWLGDYQAVLAASASQVRAA